MSELNRRRMICVALAAPLLGLGGLAAAQLTAGQEAKPTPKTIRAVMHSALRITDPILTTAYITRNHGHMIYDTLLGTDDQFRIRPQMANWTVSPDKLTYTFKLRDGLKWHDGTPVTAADCVASLKRWAVKDGMGQLVMDNTESLEATDDKTITLKLKRPISFVLDALGKISSYPPFMMPERIAKTPATQAITEYIGSGAFKFVAEEFQPGVKAVYVKNDAYLPRQEPPNWTAGNKLAKVDRVEWIVMPDANTQINALLAGQIDIIEDIPFDLLPLLEGKPDIHIGILDTLGSQVVARMNFLHPPFNKVEIRRAAMYALNQKDFLDALVGNPEYYELCGAMFVCGTPLASNDGAEPVLGDTMDQAKKILKESGYDGTPVTILQPTDVGILKTHPIVAAQLLREAGFNIDMRPTDWQTVVARRASQKPPSQGGWNLFFTLWGGSDLINPLVNENLNGRGTDGAWFGWPDDPKLEEFRTAYAEADTLEKKKKIAKDLQKYAYDQVIYIPLGQFTRQAAWRKGLTGVTDSPVPMFWNMDKS